MEKVRIQVGRFFLLWWIGILLWCCFCTKGRSACIINISLHFRCERPWSKISGISRLKMKLSLLPSSTLVSGICKNRGSLVLIWGELFWIVVVLDKWMQLLYTKSDWGFGGFGGFLVVLVGVLVIFLGFGLFGVFCLYIWTRFHYFIRKHISELTCLH